MTLTLEEFCKVYIREIVQLHGVLVSIVLDRDPRFTAHIFYNFKNIEFRLKVSLQESLLVFQIFRNSLLKKHVLNY